MLERILITSCVILLCRPLSQAQYLCVPLPSAASNPGRLNLETDIPSPMPGDGWTVIYRQQSADPVWSMSAALPFPFEFAGEAVDSFKVSSSGVLTFTTSAPGAPPYSNLALPNPAVPDKSICLLGLRAAGNFASIVYENSARTPTIRIKTFGYENPGGRQLWISFTGFSTPGLDSSRAILSNWAVVLDEGGNYIHIVDQCTFSYATITGGFKPDTLNTHLSVGIQVNASTAYTASQSPDVPSRVVNPRIGASLLFTPSDNCFYTFIPAPPADRRDLSVFRIDLDDYTNGRPSGINVRGELVNYGTPVHAFRLRMHTGAGEPIDTSLSGLDLPTGGTYAFTSGTWRPPASAGHEIRIWCDDIDGGFPDACHPNDTGMTATFYMSDPPKRRVLLEDFTGTWCGYCPRGLYAIEHALKHEPDAIGIALHGGNDPMKNPYSDAMAKSFQSGFPSGMANRATFFREGEFKPTMNIPISGYINGEPFLEKAKRLLQIPTPVSVVMTNAYDPVSRRLDVSVTARFEADASGDFRMDAVLVEDSVTGDASYDQQNYMSGDPNDPYWGKMPRVITDFVHRHVARHNMAGPDNVHGTPGLIPASVSRGGSYNAQYTHTLPAEWDASKLTIVAFVSSHNRDNARLDILNASSSALETAATGVPSLVTPASFGLQIYPMPFAGNVNLSFSLDTERDVNIEIRNMLGVKLYSSNLGRMPGGRRSLKLATMLLPAGTHMLLLSQDGKTEARPLCIVR